MVQGKKPDGPGPPFLFHNCHHIKHQDHWNSTCALWCHQTFYISSFEVNLFQVGLVPSNYLQELSQFLTQDVGGRNGSEGPVTNICQHLHTHPFFPNPPTSLVSLAGDQTIISSQRPQTVEQPMGTERRARRFRGSRGTTVQSGA